MNPTTSTPHIQVPERFASKHGCARALLLGVCVLSLLFPTVASASSTDSIGPSGDLLQAKWEQFWELVLRRNRDLQIDSVSREQAISDWSARREGLFPKVVPSVVASSVSGSGESETLKAQASAPISQWIPGGGQFLVTPSWSWARTKYGAPWPTSREDTSTLTLAWTQPLLRHAWMGDTTWGQAKLANKSAQVAEMETRVRIRVLRKEVSKIWWNAIMQAVSVLIAESDSSTCEELLTLARKKLEGGRGSILDTLLAKSEFDRAVADLAEAHIGWERVAEELGKLVDTAWEGSPESMGIVENTQNGTSRLIAPEMPDDWKWQPEEDWLSSVEKNAPEMALALAREDRAEIERRLRWWDRLPSVQVGGSARTALVNHPGEEWQYGAQFSLAWEIPNSAYRANYRRVLLDVRKQGVAKIQARRALREEYRRMRQELKWGQRRVFARLRSLQSMSQRRDVMVRLYAEGPGNMSDLLQAQREFGRTLHSVWVGCLEGLSVWTNMLGS